MPAYILVLVGLLLIDRFVFGNHFWTERKRIKNADLPLPERPGRQQPKAAGRLLAKPPLLWVSAALALFFAVGTIFLFMGHSDGVHLIPRQLFTPLVFLYVLSGAALFVIGLRTGIDRFRLYKLNPAAIILLFLVALYTSRAVTWVLEEWAEFLG